MKNINKTPKKIENVNDDEISKRDNEKFVCKK